MLSYVFLVSTAVQPTICFSDADGTRILAADPTVECESCRYDDIPAWLGGYRGLKHLSYFMLFVYGIFIPVIFANIIYKHRDKLKTGAYLKKFGFLTAKFNEHAKYWCAPFCFAQCLSRSQTVAISHTPAER